MEQFSTSFLYFKTIILVRINFVNVVSDLMHAMAPGVVTFLSNQTLVMLRRTAYKV